MYVGYAYFGWNSIAYVAGEVRDPGRTLPRALVVGTALVTLLYLALNFVFVWAAPASALSGRIEVAHVAATALFGGRAAALLSVLVATAVAGCVGAMLLAGPRILVAMAEDGLFLRALARRSSRGAPTAAVVLQGAIAMAIALGVPFDRILVYVGFTLNLTAGASVVAVFVLRRRAPDAPRPHRALGWPFSGLLFLALVTAMTVFAIRDRPWESAAGLATIVAGCLAYLRWRRGAGPRPPRAPDRPDRSPGQKIASLMRALLPWLHASDIQRLRAGRAMGVGGGSVGGGCGGRRGARPRRRRGGDAVVPDPRSHGQHVAFRSAARLVQARQHQRR